LTLLNVITIITATEQVYGRTISASDSVCFLDSHGKVHVFDDNRYGQADIPAENVDTEYIEVACSGASVCALRKEDRDIDCWSSEDWPMVDVPEGNTWKSVTTGRRCVNCGIKDDDTIECWGDNFRGSCESPPGTFSKVDVGNFGGCAIDTSGNLQCWGETPSQTDASTHDREGSFVDISMGYEHGCVLDVDGVITCFGKNQFGQTNVPTVGDKPFIGVFVGSYSSCGIYNDNTVTCWGYDIGQLDVNPNTQYLEGAAGISTACGILASTHEVECWSKDSTCRLVMPEKEGLQAKERVGYERVISAADEVCVLTSNGSIDCFGYANDEFLANQPSGYTWLTVSNSGGHSCAITSEYDAVCWDNDRYGYAHMNIPAGYKFTDIVAGRYYGTCAIRQSDSHLMCWSNGMANAPDVPVKKVSLGYERGCAIKTDGEIVCWGKWNDISPSGNFLTLDLGLTHGCAVRDDGAVVCFGDIAQYGQLDVPEGHTWIDVFCGANHSCGITDQYKVICWGWNDYGQLDGIPDAEYTSGAAGYEASCAVRRDNNEIDCWSEAKELATCIPLPEGVVASVEGELVSSISMCDTHTCSITGSSLLSGADSIECPSEGCNDATCCNPYVVDCTKRDYKDSVNYCQSQGMGIASFHSNDDTALVGEVPCIAYIGGESTGRGFEWEWHDVTSWWQYASNDGLGGVAATRLVWHTDGKWHQIGHGGLDFGVICKASFSNAESMVAVSNPDVLDGWKSVRNDVKVFGLLGGLLLGSYLAYAYQRGKPEKQPLLKEENSADINSWI